MTLSRSDLRRLTALQAATGTTEGFVPSPPRRYSNEELKLMITVNSWWHRTCAPAHHLDPRLYFQIANGNVLGGTKEERARRGHILKASGLVPGMPDSMLLVARRGWHAMMVEYKTPNGVLSDEQKALHPVLIAAGFNVEVARTLDEAVSVFESYLAPNNQGEPRRAAYPRLSTLMKSKTTPDRDVGSSDSSAYVIEVQRREGSWHRCELAHKTTQDLFRYATALGRWIGVSYGNVAAVRILPPTTKMWREPGTMPR